MKKFISEFKEFISKGNAIDLAVGVIIGGAFGTIVKSLVADIIMPPIGMLLGNVDFSDLYIQLNRAAVSIPAGTTLAAAQEQGAVVIAYGSFLMSVINFLIVGFFVFLLVKGINKLSFRNKKEEEVKAPETKVCPFCKTDIPLEASRCPHCTSQLA
ncbi:MAG: large conductance mechanosensitive channel protein MscL [Anaerolineaceae bacterium]|jgi:large conductance mechanosensitive channel|nr:large conductance mechanosensitive channel protein MscL [Anaerolineaceae bacterium]